MKINIDGSDYNLDLSKAKNLGVLTPFTPKPKRTIAIGDRFECYGAEYILARVSGHTTGLIGLADGNRWRDAVNINPVYENGKLRITDEEFNTITGAGCSFKKL